MKSPSAFLFGISILMAVCVFTQAGLCIGQKSPLGGRAEEAGEEKLCSEHSLFRQACGHRT